MRPVFAQPLVLLLLLATPLAAFAAEPSKLAPPIRDPNRFIDIDVWSWQALKQRNVVMQQYDYSCGAAVLATVIRYYWGDPATETQFLDAIARLLTPAEMKDRIENGLSMTDLRRAAVEEGYLATMGRRSMRELLELEVPVILRIKVRDHEHFVVYRGALNDRIFLADPIRGNLRVSVADFCQQWTDGVVLVVAKQGVDLPKNSPLMVRPHSPVQPELHNVRRILTLPPQR
ncbi:MAG: C39 family peptidase [Planctomycetota bacterium]